MPFCKNCGALLDENQSFCTECGQRIEPTREPQADEMPTVGDPQTPEPAGTGHEGDPSAGENAGQEPPLAVADGETDSGAEHPAPTEAAPDAPTRPVGSEADLDPAAHSEGGARPADVGEPGGTAAEEAPLEIAGGAESPSQSVQEDAGKREAPMADDGDNRPAGPRIGGGALAGIIVGCVAAVAIVGFALFYFINPLGLTTGIFENSPAAIAARAEAEKEEAEKRAEEAERAREEAERARAEAEAEPVDKTPLQEQLMRIVLYDPDQYTGESWSFLEDMVEQGREVDDDSEATQAQVDQSAARIENAIDNLVKIAVSTADYEYVPYSELARDPDAYYDRKIYYSGQVVQVVEDPTEIDLRVAVEGNYDDIVFVCYPPNILDQRVLENDFVNVYGTCTGLFTYETTSGATVSIPGMLAQKVELTG